MKIKVYQTEAADNLSQTIQENNSVAYCVEAKLTEDKISKVVWEKLKSYGSLDELNDEIFYRTKSILASTVWNKNDDIFGKAQMWDARHTPIHTYTDIDHDHKQIVGCITDTWVIDSEGSAVDDKTEIGDLPEKFHLCNAALIWKSYKDEDLVARAKTLIDEIEDGKKFVSMECLFTDFDYGVISPENKYYVVARNDETAFLTKHLRVYGGTGGYNGYKIGRFLKNMVFSGKGYVDKPANPESIIFNDENELSFSSADYKDKWFDSKPITSETLIMANATDNTESEALKAQVIELTKQLAASNVKALEEDIKEYKEEIAQADQSNKTLTEEKKSLEAKVAEVEASVKSLNDKIAELTAAKAEADEKLAQAAAEKIKSDRISLLVEGGLSKEDAEAKVAKFANFNDEQFSEVANTFIEAQKAYDEKNKDKKEKKEDKADAVEDPSKILDNAQANANDGIGAIDPKNEVPEVEKVRQSLASYFADTMSIQLTDKSGDK